MSGAHTTAVGLELELEVAKVAGAVAIAAADLVQRLAAPPGACGQAEAPCSPAALAAAGAYLHDTATLLARLSASMAPDQGYALPADGGFSLVQHVWHLADVEQFGWAERFARLLAEVQPVLPGVDGDRLAIERRYQQRPWQAAARRFVAQRRRTLAALALCDGSVLRRPVIFSGQPASGADLLAALLAHDHEHRLEMAALWAAADAPATVRPAPARPR